MPNNSMQRTALSAAADAERCAAAHGLKETINETLKKWSMGDKKTTTQDVVNALPDMPLSDGVVGLSEHDQNQLRCFA